MTFHPRLMAFIGMALMPVGAAAQPTLPPPNLSESISTVAPETSFSTEMVSCRSMPDDARRLSCYDAVAASVSFGPARRNYAWAIQKKPSRQGKGDNVVVALPAREVLTAKLEGIDPQKVSLVLRCQEKSPSFYISFPSRMTETLQELAEVVMVTATREETLKLQASKTGMAFGEWHEKSVVRSIMNTVRSSQDTTFKLSLPGDEKLTVSFDTYGGDAEISEVSEACGF